MNYCFLTICSTFNVSTYRLTFCSDEGKLDCDDGFLIVYGLNCSMIFLKASRSSWCHDLRSWMLPSLSMIL